MDNQTVQQLTIADLASIKNVIELSCSRGSFKANEMRGVGEIYDKLSLFLDAVIKQAEAQALVDAQADTKATIGATQEEGEQE